MQTITTEFKGPTNTKGSRILAKSWCKNKTVAWDHALNGEANFKAAAYALIDEINGERARANNNERYFWEIIASGLMPDGKGIAYIIDLKAI